MQIHQNASGFGDLTIRVVVDGKSVISVSASADVAYDYKTMNGKPIDRLLRYLAIIEFRKLFR